MGYKCTPQLIGLVRGEPKPGAKHRANGRDMAREAGNERYSKSETLDRSRSTQNEYEGFKSGGKCWDAMCADADAYRSVFTDKNGKTHSRALKCDAVIGWAVIFNPPADMTVGWTQDDYEKFYKDSFDVLNHIQPKLFREENVRMKAKHRDEGMPNCYHVYGEHLHLFGNAKDEDGHYCGNLIDAKLMVEINKAYPSMMRKRGWELDDLDITDFERCATDAQYREERNAKSRQKGRSVNKYLDDLREHEANVNLGIELEDARIAEELEISEARVEMVAEQYEAYEKLKAELAEERKEADEKLQAELAEERKKADAEIDHKMANAKMNEDAAVKRNRQSREEKALWDAQKAQEEAEIKNRNKESLKMHKDLKRAFMGIEYINELYSRLMRMANNYDKRSAEKAGRIRQDAESLHANAVFVKNVVDNPKYDPLKAVQATASAVTENDNAKRFNKGMEL